MTETNQSPEQVIAHSPSVSTAGKTQSGKKTKLAKSAYSKTSVRLLVDHDHALRLTSVLLERLGEPIHTM
ncbi:MAG TPA: hypothetical protein VF690_05805, partial [Hymenobacter sp.]